MWSSKLLYFRVDVDYILSLILCTSLNWENAVIRGGGRELNIRNEQYECLL